MILVIGGRSKIGAALIHELVGGGEKVRALLRSGESGQSLPAGVEPVIGDLADTASLASAMHSVERVFLLCGPTSEEVTLNKNAIDAAQAADVSLLVRSSILGADPASTAAFVGDHGVCDEYLRESGIAHAIVRPNMFMENITESTIPSIDASGTFYANAGDARLSMVDTRDVAAVAAVLLTQPGHEQGIYDVTGPEALSYEDVAAELSSALGRQVTYRDAPDDAVRDALMGFGLGDWLVGALVSLFQEYRRSGTDGYAADVTDTVPRLTGRPARTLRQLLSSSSRF